MKTITNVSRVTDYSGETPIVTDSNPVTTVIRRITPPPIITRIFYCLPCDCCDNSCNNCCNNRCGNCCDNCCNNCCGNCCNNRCGF